MAAKLPCTFYVAWIGNNDGIRFREEIPDGTFAPDDHPDWPGFPLVKSKKSGALLPDPGPNLSALFHPNSLISFEKFNRVFLLYDHGCQQAQQRLEIALRRVAEQRGWANDLAERVSYVFLEAVKDPSEPEQIILALTKWVDVDDPFGLARNKQQAAVTINLSPGTPADYVSWLMLRWRGTRRGFGNRPRCSVRYLTTDGGPHVSPAKTDAERQPTREFDFERLSRFPWTGSEAAAKPAVLPGEFDINRFRSPSFVERRGRIEKAAALGIPVLLYGERGTGKTFLATYYHRRRQHYRSLSGGPKKNGDDAKFVPVTLSELGDKDTLHMEFFGWKKGTLTGVDGDSPGFLGRANGGTLFLDEIHHLERALQAALLGPISNRKYKRRNAGKEDDCEFDLVVATNDPGWRDQLLPDFRDRIERLVVTVPSFTDLQKEKMHEDIRAAWDHVILRRCQQCNVQFEEPPQDCSNELDEVFRRRRLAGNWRDLERLADYLLIFLTDDRMGHLPPLVWDRDRLLQAVDEALP